MWLDFFLRGGFSKPLRAKEGGSSSDANSNSSKYSSYALMLPTCTAGGAALLYFGWRKHKKQLLQLLISKLDEEEEEATTKDEQDDYPPEAQITTTTNPSAGTARAVCVYCGATSLAADQSACSNCGKPVPDQVVLDGPASPIMRQQEASSSTLGSRRDERQPPHSGTTPLPTSGMQRNASPAPPLPTTTVYSFTTPPRTTPSYICSPQYNPQQPRDPPMVIAHTLPEGQSHEDIIATNNNIPLVHAQPVGAVLPSPPPPTTQTQTQTQTQGEEEELFRWGYNTPYERRRHSTVSRHYNALCQHHAPLMDELRDLVVHMSHSSNVGEPTSHIVSKAARVLASTLQRRELQRREELFESSVRRFETTPINNNNNRQQQQSSSESSSSSSQSDGQRCRSQGQKSVDGR